MGSTWSRCRVCRNDKVRKKVNDLLASGASYAMILRALGEDNAKLDKRDRVTIDSVRNHCGRHFPVQQVARATYRDILERRAQENQVDFVNGVATAITPMAFLETVMVRGYETLVDERTTVSYRDGMESALKLAEALRKEEGEYDTVHMRAEMRSDHRRRQGVHPREKWPELQAKLRVSHPHPRRPLVRESLRHRLSGSSPSATGTRKSDVECSTRSARRPGLAAAGCSPLVMFRGLSGGPRDGSHRRSG